MRPGRAHGQHAAHADLAGGGVDADLDEVRAEGRLLVLLVEVAVLDRVLGDEVAVAGGLGQRHAARRRRGPGRRRTPRRPASKPEPSARPPRAASRRRRRRRRSSCCAPHWPPEPARHREGRIAEPHDDLVERHAHHLGRGLRDDGVAAGADVGHVGLDRHDAVARRAARARADFISRLLRKAAATPMPTSQRPSRTCAGLRRCAGSSRSARRRCAGTRRAGAARTGAPAVRASRDRPGCR